MHILLTRPLEDSRELILRFKSLGHQVSHLPVIDIEKEDYDEPNYNEFKGIIFSGGNSLLSCNGDSEERDKLEKKMYRKHTGYPGGLKEVSYSKILGSKYPDRLLRLTVKRMLPKGTLGREQIKKLHIYAGESHPHEAQKPKNIDFKNKNKKNYIGKKIGNG